MKQERCAGCTVGRAAKFFQISGSLEEPRGPLDMSLCPPPPRESKARRLVTTGHICLSRRQTVGSDRI